MLAPKTITVQELEKSTQRSVWVMNNTPATMLGVSPGTLYKPSFNIANEYGEKTRVSVPSTFIPYDLTAHATKKQLVASTSFRNQVLKRNLLLVSEETALKYINELADVYSKELTRITQVKHKALEEKELSDEDKEDENWARMLLGVEGEVRQYDETQVIRKLRMSENEISQTRWKFIVQFANDDSVKEFALEHLK